MYSKIFKILMCACAMTMVSCADREVRKEVSQEVKAEPEKKAADLHTQAIASVENNTSFSPEQKQKLLEVIERTHKKNLDIVSEDKRLKGVLIKTITATPYKDAEVAELKSRLLKVNRERIKNEMTALNEVQHILGKDKHTDHDMVYRELLMQPPGVLELQ